MAWSMDPVARVALSLCIRVALVEARDSRNQFTEFFATFNGWYYGEGKVAQQNYISAPEIPEQHSWAWELVDCILGITSEAQKAEFALSATLLTVLPVRLAQIRPGLTDTGCLAIRRPLLALMLQFGVPSPNPITGTIDGRKVRKLGTSRPLKQLKSLGSFGVCAWNGSHGQLYLSDVSPVLQGHCRCTHRGIHARIIRDGCSWDEWACSSQFIIWASSLSPTHIPWQGQDDL